jgi:hypothetical protein
MKAKKETRVQKERRIIKELLDMAQSYDPESAHGQADDLLLEWIDDPDVTAAYNAIEKWYA